MEEVSQKKFKRPVCRHCGNHGGLKLCAVCRDAWYCSKECQRADWATHKPVCKGTCKFDIDLFRRAAQTNGFVRRRIRWDQYFDTSFVTPMQILDVDGPHAAIICNEIYCSEESQKKFLCLDCQTYSCSEKCSASHRRTIHGNNGGKQLAHCIQARQHPWESYRKIYYGPESLDGWHVVPYYEEKLWERLAIAIPLIDELVTMVVSYLVTEELRKPMEVDLCAQCQIPFSLRLDCNHFLCQGCAREHEYFVLVCLACGKQTNPSEQYQNVHREQPNRDSCPFNVRGSAFDGHLGFLM